MTAYSKPLLLTAASIMAMSFGAANSETKNSPLERFHQLSVEEHQRCKDQNATKLSNIETEIRLADRRASMKYDLMKQARGYGMRDRVNQLEQETQSDLSAFIVKRDQMLDELSKTAQVCADEATTKLKAAFAPAHDSIKSKQQLSPMLKDYFAAELTVLSETVPALGEKQADYTARQTAAVTKLKDLWNRFEVEASY